MILLSSRLIDHRTDRRIMRRVLVETGLHLGCLNRNRHPAWNLWSKKVKNVQICCDRQNGEQRLIRSLVLPKLPHEQVWSRRAAFHSRRKLFYSEEKTLFGTSDQLQRWSVEILLFDAYCTRTSVEKIIRSIRHWFTRRSIRMMIEENFCIVK